MQLNAFGKGRFMSGRRHAGAIPELKKLVLMQLKLIPVLLMAALSAAAGGFGQKVSVAVKEVPLEKVIAQVKVQTGYLFFYDGSVLKRAKPVTIAVQDMPLQSFLDQVFKNQPISYTVQNTTVILSAKESARLADALPLEAVMATPPSSDFHGRVADSVGNPLSGAAVAIKGTKQGVFTDANGYFTLTGVTSRAVIVVSFTGYVDKEITLTEKSTGFDNQRMYIILTRNDNILDEMQVIAYGQTSRRLSTGNVSTVKAKDIEKAPVNNPILAIAGRVPGVFITQATGFAGAGVQVQVQGQSSIAQGTVPFYVVDGVPFMQYMLTPLNSVQGNSGVTSGGGYGNPLSFINPQDIESIDVLKDADATAIYGSRAAAGAILITTKKGKAGRTSLSLNVQQGFGEVAKKMDNLNTSEYLAMRKEAFTDQGLAVPVYGTTTPASTNYDLTFWDQNRYTDWQKALIGGKAGYSDAQLSFTGGNANTQIMLGANYHRETTVLPGNLSYKRGNVHFSMSHASADQRFKMTFGGSYLSDNNTLPSVDLTAYAMKLAPNAPALYDSTGALNWAVLPSGSESWSNPLRFLQQKYKSNTSNLQGNAEISYRLIDNLTLKSTFGYTKLETAELYTTPQTYYGPSTTTNGRGTFISNKYVANWIVEPQLTYQLKKKYGKFDVLLGTTFQKNKYNLLSFAASGFTNDAQLENIYAATAVAPTNAIQETYNYNAVFGRLNYSYQDKYILNLTVRRDGSSRFGNDNLFHTFYGAGGAWLFTKEDWMKDVRFLSFGKLRASYGTTGNDQIGNYAFMSLYKTYAATIPYGGGSTLRSANLSNPGLQWESTHKFNAGMDLGFLKDRLVLNLNYYINTSSNQLLSYSLPILTGFSTITRNFPATVRNSGVEFVISSDNFKSRDFKWTTNLNVTIPRNRLVSFPGLATSSYANTLIVGKSLSVVKTWDYVGVNPTTGHYNFQRPDKSLVEVPTLNKDETGTIDKNPKYYGGLQNTFSYKGFSLDVLLQFAKRLAYDETRFGYTAPGAFTTTTGNQPAAILNNYWKQAGDQASLQVLSPNVTSLNTIYVYTSSFYNRATWTDGSYIRVKNVSLSYSLPASVTKPAHLQQARLYIQGQNLLTFTRYKGLDVETQSTFTLPPLRVITFGVQLTL